MFFGLPRAMGWCGEGSAAIRLELRTVDCRIGPWKEHMAEYETFDASSDQVLKAGPLGNVPVVIISEDSGKGSHWDVLQASLIQISTDSCRIIAKRSGHDLPSERPDLIAGVARKLVEQPHADQAARVTTTDLLEQFDCVR